MIRYTLTALLVALAIFACYSSHVGWSIAACILALPLAIKPIGEACVFALCACIEPVFGIKAATCFNSFCTKWLGIGV